MVRLWTAWLRTPESGDWITDVGHLLAHVHVQLRDGRECTVELDSLTLVGRIAMREIREELLWIESNRAWLQDEWRRLNP
ncbi:MAG: DUF4160 domain-containing protein [Betaproteobacteria bacterium]|nr:DUF4160 domain-containing protein [Betaproteobacteria bacterium]